MNIFFNKISVNMRNWLTVILVLVSVLKFISCGNSTVEPVVAIEEVVQSLSSVENIEVDAISAATRSNTQPIFNGTLVIPPQRHATITLFMDGTVKNTSLLPGVYKRKGELLATLENPEYVALQQSYIESLAQEEFLEAEYRRQELLFRDDVSSKKIYQQSKAEYLTMKSRREAAAAQLVMLGLDVSRIISSGIIPYLELRSPINGYVANVQANIGRYIAAGEVVCEIIDKDVTMLKLTIYEKDIDKINIGDKIEFRVNGISERTFNASVVSLGQMVDNLSRSIDVYATVIDKDTRLRPGMYVSARSHKKSNP